MNEKKYLELEGLKALIIKIGSLREEFVDKNTALNDFAANLYNRLNNLIKEVASEDGVVRNEDISTKDYDYPTNETDSKSVLKLIAEYIQEFRDELGKLPEGTDKASIYERLDEIEGWVNDEGKGLLERATKLEEKSFAGVECSSAEDVKANHLWEAFFKNAAGERLKTDDGKDVKITLDTKDFIIDGMLGDVKTISVVNRGVSITDLATGTNYKSGEGEPWDTLIEESASRNDGEHYLVFTFKTKDSDGHNDTDNNYVGENELKNIWVSVNDLHDNFDFKAAHDDYVILEVSDPKHTANGSTEIAYSAKLADNVVEVLEKALGENPDVRSYDEIDGDLTKDREDIDMLQVYVEKGGFEETIENEDGTKTTIERKGLLERATDLENKFNEFEDKTANEIDEINTKLDNVIPSKFVEDYFDAIVFASDIQGSNPRTSDYEKVSMNVIDKTWVGDTPDVDDYKNEDGYLPEED